MRSKSIRATSLGLFLLLLPAARPARAIIVITDTPNGTVPFTVTQIFTTDPAYTTSAFNNSGSQYEGRWEVGGGTVVGPNTFLTATHLLGTVGDGFIFNNSTYTTTSSTDVGNGMTLWTVNGTFPTFAPVFGNDDPATNPTAPSVKGDQTSHFGFGLAPNLGAPVTGPDGVQGYQWAGNPGALSWGPSSVFGYAHDPTGGDFLGTDYLYGAFHPALGTGHASITFATDDSGGGVFAFINGQWRLVGVNLGINQSTYFPNPNGTGGVNAAMWDQNGFFDAAGNPITDDGLGLPPGFNPQIWFADAITPTVAAAIASVPEPAALGLLATGAGLAGLARLRRRPRGRGAAPTSGPDRP